MSRKWIYGRNVIVSGCSTGMGRDITKLLVIKYGCNVVGIARNKQKLDELKTELGDKFTYRRFDVASEQAWYDFKEQLQVMDFSPDILINNAGVIQPFTAYNDLEMSQIMKVVDTNYMSILYSLKALLPVIKMSNHAGIVNVASASAILPVAGESIYSSSKCAVRGLTETLGQELRGHGVYVSCIMPGPVKTDIYKAREADGDKESKVKDNMVENIGLTSGQAAKKIIKCIKKKKTRLALGVWAKFMDFGMRLAPRLTPILTGRLIKKFVKFVPSFQPIYAEEIEKKDEIKAVKKSRKNNTYKSYADVPKTKPFENDKLD